MINPILLEKLDAEGKIRISRSAGEGGCVCMCIYLCVCVYMYIHVCIKRRKSHGVRGAQIQGSCDS